VGDPATPCLTVKYQNLGKNNGLVVTLHPKVLRRVSTFKTSTPRSNFCYHLSTTNLLAYITNCYLIRVRLTSLILSTFCFNQNHPLISYYCNMASRRSRTPAPATNRQVAADMQAIRRSDRTRQSTRKAAEEQVGDSEDNDTPQPPPAASTTSGPKTSARASAPPTSSSSAAPTTNKSRPPKLRYICPHGNGCGANTRPEFQRHVEKAHGIKGKVDFSKIQTMDYMEYLQSGKSNLSRLSHLLTRT
jgi:hypothetical protein